MRVEIDIPDDPADLTLGAVVTVPPEGVEYSPEQAARRDMALRDLLADIEPYRSALSGRG
jgi:hypothetical protein